MKELFQIVEAYEKLQSSKLRVAMATVVNIEGSSYRRIGARMLIFENGDWIGGISGGCLEGDVLKNAKKVMSTGKSRLITYDTRDGDPYQIGVGLGCRGKIDIFLESLQESNNQRVFDFYRECLTSREIKGLALVLNQTQNEYDLNQGDKFIFGEEMPEVIRKGLVKSIQEGTSQILQVGDTKILNEVFLPRFRLILVGDHYDIPPLVRITYALHWEILLISNLDKLDKGSSKYVTQVFNKREDHWKQEIQLDGRTALVLVSHDYKTDIRFLSHYLGTNVPYIGVLGPVDRYRRLIEDLRLGGVDIKDKDLNRIHAPIGLDIGAENPEEIALAIIAEITAFFKNRSGGSLRLRGKPIYDV